jgi:hypothetical protein
VIGGKIMANDTTNPEIRVEEWIAAIGATVREIVLACQDLEVRRLSMICRFLIREEIEATIQHYFNNCAEIARGLRRSRDLYRAAAPKQWMASV